MSATDGLTRGMEVIDTGAPISVPVGERLWDEFLTGVNVLREGNDLYMEMKESGVINEENIAESKVALVYGQMNEPPGARRRVGLTALTMAEYFRDVNEQDLLLFIDNIFRFSSKQDPKYRPYWNSNNEITVLVNDAEKGSDIDPQEAQQTLEIADANVKKAEGRRQKLCKSSSPTS
ncbi:hypothetical protein HAX54_044942 [Datura stramonium]|uniref:H(+)-transporting two-sector ATPase n=1 Tax=Datura stramonium TaxID=4076 RepID=A0ABS8SPQ0_DATST|nr:hypothetical protein [Datura stramonium]